MTNTDKQNLIQSRVVSIDALRGFDMFWIIGGGAVFETLEKIRPNRFTEMLHTQLTHVDWAGFHFEDLIFPLFLFIVGLVIPFAISRRLEKGQTRTGLYIHIFKRSILLFLLGLIYYGLLKFNLSNTRWLGVLQRIALCYFFAAIIVMNTTWRIQAALTAGILLLYWAILTLIPVPGYGAGVITPEGCLPSYIDQLLLPGRFCCYKFGDNEGLLSTLPAIATTLIGALAGHWLRSQHSGNRKTAGLALAGLGCLVTGYIWGLAFPIIKVIWTSSYVLYAAGYSLLLLAIFYWFIDVRGCKKWALFFIVIGLNPITIYFAQSFVNFADIAKFFLAGLAEHSASLKPLVLALGTLSVKWLTLLFLYRHKIFFKV